MEIEVGEYVRTKRGYIRKVIRRDMDKHILLDIGFEGANYLTKVEEKEDIVKHSKNIINLVEVGDYVNGYKVISVDYDVIDNKTECIELDLNNNYQYNFISTNQIKTIITKKQFSNIEYEVEEDKQ